ncbi:BTAD domain-containing putative transcriptional regulator [Lentzea sp. NPDC059081]|uniref:AfsR/SARP family transcriptional regulator n=1 Tax=Lentzea sp. NPDC059081 TaxID=3346719 RepID=UPI00367377D1
MTVELGVLGEVTAHVDGRVVDLGPARQRCVLAALAVDAGRVVPADQLVERVWGADTPRRGRATLQSYVSRLRGALPVDGPGIVLRSGGYALVLDGADHVVDLHRFRELRATARGATGGQAVALLTEAVALRRGEPLTGLTGEWAEAVRDELLQELLAADQDLVDARLRAGDGEDLLAELAARAARHPLDERTAGQYLLALHRSGRTADALRHYQRLRGRLVEELGADPGPRLRELHQRILAADSTLSVAPPAAPPAVVPRQLPATPAHFTGRADELASLTATLDESGPDRTVVISAIGGTGGIGKTWLAVHWAHQRLDRFPDGQLFVDLRGFSPAGAPMASAAAVRGFLDALGADPGRIPVDPHAQTALFRSLVAGRRMLIVLDNAAGTEQVLPLLPGGSSCTVLITSRATLTGVLTRHSAHHLALGTMTDDEARAVLVRRLGADRVAAEPDAVAELIGFCDGLPLALGIIAARAHTHPSVPLAEFAADLRELGMAVLEEPSTGVPTVLSWSYRVLTPEQQRVFCLLGVAPGPDIGLPAVAALTGLPATRAARVLRDLQDASLLNRGPNGRFSMHDLIRRYATEVAEEQPREDALRRVVGFYLHTANAADQLLDPRREPLELDPLDAGCLPQPVPGFAAAVAWFDTEHLNLQAAQQTAAAHLWHRQVWQLAWTLGIYQLRRGHRRDRVAVWQAGLTAAGHLRDPATDLLVHRQLGNAYTELGWHDEAVDHLNRALALARRQDDPAGEAHTHRMLAWAWGLAHDDERALDHSTSALELYRAIGNPTWEAHMLNSASWYIARLGDHDRARDHCHTALKLYHLNPDPDGEAATWDTLGYIDHSSGLHAEAVGHYRRAQALLRDLGALVQVAGTLERLGEPHAALGQHAEARAVWREALELYRDQGRDDDAARVQRLLDGADPSGETQPPA